MLRTRNFQTLYELCDFVKENNIDVYSEDVKYLGDYFFSPERMGVCYTLGARHSSPKYTIQYEDNQNNLGPLQIKYVEDFSEIS